ncbi:MAG: alanyl-tRNA synthetase [Thermoleophilaceae bacterium]|jgi:alanyl-tRNA synthetase|nr:alanyl-tRNA synthetase [Thermoleophilaceae bacterium]
MQAREIRERFLSFFEERGHLRLPSASLVPSVHDPSVLLTVAGMQPLKPYFQGEEEPPARRLTSCQKSFRTVDIEVVGTTKRHLTFFEMLGNFSVGDYFKQGAAEYAWELSTQGFDLDPESIWITVFGGDDEVGLGPDDEAIECWRSIGIPDERIVLLGREHNFWQSGPSGPCGPCSELYLDRGPAFGGEDDRPGDDTERFLEFWNLVFMQYELHEDGSLTELPMKSIDTGLGVERMAAILQNVESVFETDELRPLVEFGEQRSGRSWGQDFETTRALGVLADHGRAGAFLLADGVVPSNEDRGYVLRRIMRRAMRQGHVLGIEGAFLADLYRRVVDVMSYAYPELEREWPTIERWARTEEESFARTLEQGERLLSELIAQAKQEQTSWVSAEDAFRLHDTYGFPYEMTKELLAEEGLSVDDQGFEDLMERAREVSRSRGARATADDGADVHVRHEDVLRFARDAGFRTRFVGYETTESDTVLRVAERANGWVLAKLEESPFYPEGGGQVSDTGVVETPSGRARVADVYRLGDDQALALEPLEGEIGPGESARAVVERGERLATMRNHTATHLLHAALRDQLGTHVRQAGSYVGPDKLRFDFTHGARLSDEELAAVEGLVSGWVTDNHPVRAIETTRDEAERLGAMALFGEKYGDWVRMVEVDAVSRELCGGTHVASTGELGLFHLVNESSSASNVRRIEAITGPASTQLFRERSERLRELATLLRVPEDSVVRTVERLSERLKELERGGGAPDRGAADQLVEGAGEVDGVRVVVEPVSAPDAKALLALSDAVRQRLGDAVVVLGTAVDGRVHLVANVAPAVVERGVKAGDVVRAAAEVAGGGGGGRDTMAQAGGRDPEKLPEALATARAAIEQALRG